MIYTDKQAHGIILGKKDSELISTDINAVYFEKPIPDHRYLFCPNNILAKLDDGASFIAAASNDDIYKATAKAAEDKGYRVRVLDLKDPEGSNTWDPLDCLKKTDPDMMINRTEHLARSIIRNGSKGHAFFDKNEENLLKAVLLYLVYPYPGIETGSKTMGDVYDLLLDIYNNHSFNIPEDHPAFPSWDLFKDSGKIGVNIVLQTLSKLSDLEKPKIRKLLSGNDLDLSMLRMTPCAYYVIYPKYGINAPGFIPGLFINSSIEQLVRSSLDKNVTDHVYLILDDYTSIGRISNFETAYLHSKKYKISFILTTMSKVRVFKNCVWLTKELDRDLAGYLDMLPYDAFLMSKDLSDDVNKVLIIAPDKKYILAQDD